MSGRRILARALVFGCVGASDAAAQCFFVKYPALTWRELQLSDSPSSTAHSTTVRRITKLKVLNPPYPASDWRYVETIPTTTGSAAIARGWVPASRVGPEASCFRAFR
jgi:hypothetical protein